MPVRVEWDDPSRTILHFYLEGSWTWDEMLIARETSDALLTDSARVTPVIMDALTSNGIPPGQIAAVRRLIMEAHPFSGFTVVVLEENTMLYVIQNLLLMVDKLYKVKWDFRFAHSLDEARAMIAQSHLDASS